MEVEELDRVCVNYRFILNGENSKKLSAIVARARSTTNKEEARHVRTKANTLVVREILSQL